VDGSFERSVNESTRRAIRQVTDARPNRACDAAIVMLSVEIEEPFPCGGPPSGTVTTANGDATPFSGWTGLLAVLFELGQSVACGDEATPSAG
jgi:hypothetical protein